MTKTYLTEDNDYVTVYTTLDDFVQQEIAECVADMGEGFDRDAFVDALREAGHIIWEDGYNESDNNFYLDRQGFRWSDQMIEEAQHEGSKTFWTLAESFDK